jgi:hypothetical protein
MKLCVSSWSKAVSGFADFFLLAAASFRRFIEGGFIDRSVFAALFFTPCMLVGLGCLPFGMGVDGVGPHTKRE